jgi:hypothetical protein
MPTRTASLLKFGTLFALMSPVSSAHAQRGTFDMTIARKTEMKTVDGPEDYFTGKVTITGQFQRGEPSRISGAIVHFDPGARTAWHTHPAGQRMAQSWNSTPAISFGAPPSTSTGMAPRRIKA